MILISMKCLLPLNAVRIMLISHRRRADHFAGKAHLAYLAIRKRLTQLEGTSGSSA